MPKWPATPFEIGDYDNPETVRFRKYATGAHLLLEADLRPGGEGRTVAPDNRLAEAPLTMSTVLCHRGVASAFFGRCWSALDWHY